MMPELTIPDECSECGEAVVPCPCCGEWATSSGLARYCPASETGRHIRQVYA